MKDAIRNFFAAVMWGALAGGGPFLLFTVPLTLPEIADQPMVLIGLGLMPLWVAAIATTGGMVMIGLPVTTYLRDRDLETTGRYTLAGLLGGIAIPPAIFLAAGDTPIPGLFFSLPGALAGCFAGGRWGQWRETLARRRNMAAEFEDTPPEPSLRPRRGPEKWLS